MHPHLPYIGKHAQPEALQELDHGRQSRAQMFPDGRKGGQLERLERIVVPLCHQETRVDAVCGDAEEFQLVEPLEEVVGHVEVQDVVGMGDYQVDDVIGVHGDGEGQEGAVEVGAPFEREGFEG